MLLKNPVVFNTTFAQYTSTEIIGEGGAGRIYKATDDAGSVYAIKLLTAAKPNSETMKRFKNEVQFCSKHDHKNIIKVVDHGVLPDGNKLAPFYVMPLYTASLRDLLGAKIPHDKVLPYFSQLLDGVEAAHLYGVTHRDLKPENVLYDESRDLLLVADFGIAYFEEEAIYTAVQTKESQRLANFQYAATEQRGRGATKDHHADIYALGLILNEMFTGVLAHGTGYVTVKSVAAEYAYLDEIVSQMLRQSPNERLDSIAAIKGQLQGRKLDFVTLQRISELKKTVVSTSEIDDPLVVNPPELIDGDYQRGALILYLSRPVNDRWVSEIRNMRASFESMMGKGPERFRFSGDTVTVPAREDEAQQIVDYFKTWLPIANRQYAERIRREKQEEEEQQRRERQKEIEELERQQRVRARLKI